MKEHPILFSGEMVRAILEGKKTQTRRVMRPQPKVAEGGVLRWHHHGMSYAYRDEWVEFCPYGAPDDRLWVREGWAVGKRLDNLPPRKLEFLTANPDFPQSTIYYRADCFNGVNPLRGRWRPSIYMPRWASRIMLEVTGVRVERVQDISEEDAKAEGVEAWHSPYPEIERYNRPGGSYRNGFHELWDGINAKRGFGWDVNPWIWVIDFTIANERTGEGIQNE